MVCEVDICLYMVSGYLYTAGGWSVNAYISRVSGCLYMVGGWSVRSTNAYIRSLDACVRLLDGR